MVMSPKVPVPVSEDALGGPVQRRVNGPGAGSSSPFVNVRQGSVQSVSRVVSERWMALVNSIETSALAVASGEGSGGVG